MVPWEAYLAPEVPADGTILTRSKAWAPPAGLSVDRAFVWLVLPLPGNEGGYLQCRLGRN